MAVLTPLQRDGIRQDAQALAPAAVIDYQKPHINAAIQACEDWFEANKSNLVTAIQAASLTAGKQLTAVQCRRVATAWLRYKLVAGVT